MFTQSENRRTYFYYEDVNNPYLLTQRIDHNGAITNYNYSSEGNLKEMEDPYGNVTTYVYAQETDSPLNPKHRHLVREIHRPAVTVDGSLVQYAPTILEYDANGNLEKMTDALEGVIETTRTADGLVEWVTNRRGFTSRMVYDTDTRNLMEIWVPTGLESATTFRKTFYTYNDYGEVLTVRDELGNEVSQGYDRNGRQVAATDARGQTSSLTFIDGDLVETSMPANNGSLVARGTSFNYDQSGRLQTLLRDVGAGQELRVKYLYDAMSRTSELIRIKNGSERSFVFSYDALSRLLTSTDPLDQQSSIAWESSCTGRTEKSARGIGRKYGVDLLCRTTLFQTGAPNPVDPLYLTSIREAQTYEYDELGRLTKSAQLVPGSEYSMAAFGLERYGTKAEEKLYRYDELDRLVEMSFRADEDPAGAHDRHILYEYDAEGNLIRQTDPEQKVTRYTYYRDNSLREVIVEREGEADRIFTYSYDVVGRMLSVQYPEETGVTALFEDETNAPGSGWDESSNLLHLRYEKDGILIRRFQFTYDASGNRESMMDVTSVQAVKWEYTYDWLDRLVMVKRAVAADVASLPALLPVVALYTYDASDNRVEYRLEQEDLTCRYTVDDADRLLAQYRKQGTGAEGLYETYVYDEDGNLTSRALADTGETITYQFDDLDQLVGVRSAIDSIPTPTVRQANRYDVERIRKRKAGKTTGATVEWTSGSNSIASRTAASTPASLSYLVGHQLLGYEENGAFRYFLTDSLSTVRDVLDEEGEVIQSYEFGEFGLPLPGSGLGTATTSPKTFVGGHSVHDDLADSGLFYMRQRYYDPGLGRWLNADPIGFRGGLNLYNYVGQNPVNGVDPSGLIDPRSVARFAGKTWNLVTNVGPRAGCGAVERFGLRGLLGLAAGEAALPLTLIGLSGYGAYRMISGPSPNGPASSSSSYVPSGIPLGGFASEASITLRGAHIMTGGRVTPETANVAASIQTSGMLRSSTAGAGQTGIFMHYPETMNTRNYPTYPQVSFYTTIPLCQFRTVGGRGDRGSTPFFWAERSVDLPIRDMEFRNVP